MNLMSSPTCCVVCGGATPSAKDTFCSSCEKQILMAFEALKEGGSVVIVPPSVN